MRLKFVGKFVKFTDLDQGMGMDGGFSPGNAFAGLAPSQDFDKPSNFIIRPSKMDQMDDDDGAPPF